MTEHAEIVKILRGLGYCPHGPPSETLSLKEFGKKHTELCSELASKLTRVKQKPVQLALVSEGVEPGLAASFAAMVNSVVEDCKLKMKGMTSGTRTDEHCKQIIAALRKKPKSSPSPSPSPSPNKNPRESSPKAAASTARSSSTPSTWEAIKTLYSKKGSESSIVAVSSQESKESASEHEEATHEDVFDWHELKMVRFFSDGKQEAATMSEGPQGFAVARFESTGEVAETEATNLMLALHRAKASKKGKAGSTVSKKRPASKRPSCATAKAKVGKKPAMAEPPPDPLSPKQEEEAEEEAEEELDEEADDGEVEPEVPEWKIPEPKKDPKWSPEMMKKMRNRFTSDAYHHQKQLAKRAGLDNESIKAHARRHFAKAAAMWDAEDVD